jgi:hypothetical protein
MHLWSATHLTVLLAVALLSGCSAPGGGESKDSTAQDADSTLRPLGMPAGTRPRDPTCFFDTVNGRKCTYVFDTSDPMSISPAVLREAAKNLRRGKESYRQENCQTTSSRDCQEQQFASTLYNADVDSADIGSIPPNMVMLVGALRLKAGVRSDRLYKVESGVPPNGQGEDKGYLFFLVRKSVVAHPPSSGNSAAFAVQIAEWITVVVDEDKVRQIDVGGFMNCKKHHRVTIPSTFLSCQSADIVAEQAERLQLSFDDVHDCVARVSSTVTGKLPASQLRNCLTERVFAVTRPSSVRHSVDKALLEAAITALQTVKDDAATATFWLTCLPGCCTADEILQ